jgi:hypothetical protein
MTAEPDDTWIDWKPVAEASAEPARTGWIQFAVPNSR